MFELKAGFCKSCQIEIENAATERAEVRTEIAKSVDVDKVVITTENHSGLRVKKRIDVVSAECAFGMNRRCRRTF